MVASDNDRSFDLAPPNEFVHGNAKFGAFAVAEPEDSSRQTLKMNSLLCQLHPAGQGFVFRKQFERKLVCAGDVVGLAAQRHPTKRALSFAKERPDVFRNESGNVEGVFDAGFLGLRPNVVAVIEGDRDLDRTSTR